MTTGIKSQGVDLDQLFDPDVVGDGPSATGYKINGVALRFADIKYGSKRANVGYAQAGVDVSNLWAAKGTASYALPIDGQTYTSAINITSGSGNATIGFRVVSGNTWQVYKTNSDSGVTVLASGSVPAGAATVKYTWGAYVVGVGQTDAGGATVNGAASATSIASNPDAHYTTGTNTATSGSRDRRYPFTVDFYSAAAANISHTDITLIGDTEGSI